MARHTYLAALLWWGLAGGLGWLAHSWWRQSAAGDGLAQAGAVIGALLALRIGFRGLAAWDERTDQRRVERLADLPSTAYGSARWATLKEAKRARMTEGKGIFLGSLHGRDLYYPGETHGLVVAPPGAGKGVCLAVPNLLTYPGSMVVTDPKGELTAITAQHRKEKLGHRIVVINPWRKDLKRELGEDLGGNPFNPLSFLKPGPRVKDDAELVASLLLPMKPGGDGKEDFFTDFGQSILTAVILYLVQLDRPELLTLPELRRLLLTSPTELKELLVDLSQCDAFGGVIREYGGKLLGTFENAPEEFQGGLSSAQKALRIYDSHGPLGEHVSKGKLDFASLKTKPTTVYIIMPSDRATTHAAWLNLVVSLAVELVGRDRSNRRVLFLLDELANMYLPNILRAMAQYRGQGVQCVSIIQQISQLERLYGHEGMRDFLGMAELICTFGVWEAETLRLLSGMLGEHTVKDFSENVTPEAGGNERNGFNYGATNRGSPLLRPEDIRTMPSDEMLIFYRNLLPIRAKKVSYLDRPEWRRAARPNPYHRHGKH